MGASRLFPVRFSCPHADTTLVRVLSFERAVVATLVGVDAPTARREAIEQYVDECLRAMPEHLRIGVAAESVVLGSWARLRGRRSGASLDRELGRWKTNPVDPIRQYVRVFESLVLFATYELELDAGDVSSPT